MFDESFRAMNTEIVLLAEGNEQAVRQGFLEVRDFIEASERRFTRFSEDSELSSLNRSAGKHFLSSEDFFSVMEEARDCYRRTHGLFDPSILPQLKNAGYTRSMDELRIHGAGEGGPIPAHRHGFDTVGMDPSGRMITLPEGMQIDLGGIAKGWIAERATGILKKFSTACAVNAGGDMFMNGYPEDQDYWEVSLEDPRDITCDLALLRVQEGAVATSSITRRTWKQGGVNRHHLIDPRTGEPAVTPWLSVTVMAPHAAEAETFAKAFLMADEQEAAALSRENPGITALGADQQGKLVLLSGIMEGYHVS